MLNAIDTAPGIVKLANRQLAYGAFPARLIDSTALDVKTEQTANELGSSSAANNDSTGVTANGVAPDRAGTSTADAIATALSEIDTTRILAAINAANTLARTIDATPLASSAASSTVTTEAVPAQQSTTEANPGTSGPAASATAPAGNAPTAPTANAGQFATTPAAASAVSLNSPLDPVAQALSNIAENPAYAAIAATLYLNVASYRAPQALALAQPDTPRPPNGIIAGKGVDTGRNEEEANQSQPKGGSKARAAKA